MFLFRFSYSIMFEPLNQNLELSVFVYARVCLVRYDYVLKYFLTFIW